MKPILQPKILILGGTGQLARALQSQTGSDSIVLQRPQLELADPEAAARSLRTALESHPTLRAVFNATAYTAVDQAEREPELAHRINAVAPGLLASVCREGKMPFVHYSTDYVFDGSGSRPWTESQPTGPLSVYGRTKLAGEAAVRASGAQHLIFRTSWVYDAHGKNFVRTMLALFAKRPELSVVADQWGAPTYAPHLAKLSLQALDRALAMEPFPSGIYHLANTGETNWNRFARVIWVQARQRQFANQVESPERIREIPAADYPVPAPRPLNSRLNLEKFKTTFGLNPPAWEQGLRECFEEIRK